MFLENKYTKIYYQIVDRAKTRIIEGYSERHHIVPKSLGGSDKKENLVPLTAREHFICHWLLTKMTVGIEKGKMIYAVWMLATNNNPNQKREKISSRKYEILKRLMSEKEISNETRRKMGLGRLGKEPPNKGVPMSEEQKIKLSIANKGKKIPKEIIEKGIETKRKNGTLRVKGSWSPSAETRKKLSEALKGHFPWNKNKKLNEEQKVKIKASFTDERRKQISDSKKGKPLSPQHLESVRIAQAKRRERERQEKLNKIESGEIVIEPKIPKKRGPKPGMYKHSPETRQKLKEAALIRESKKRLDNNSK